MQEQVRILETDSETEIAMKIFGDFVVNQSCTIKGYCHVGTRVELKGEEVLKILEQMDRETNCYVSTVDGRPRRKRARPDNTIGGWEAQKMFRFSHGTRDAVPFTNIWRIQ